MRNILIIQTAFIGDVILATPLIETIHHNFPTCKIDFMVRKGNEDLLQKHPYINKLYVFKKENKVASLFENIRSIRKEKYEIVINLQRFASSGLIAALSGGREIVGFKKNPFSFLFHRRIEHLIGNMVHEVDRNLSMLKAYCNELVRKPKLYPTEQQYAKVNVLREKPFICLAPASVWKTKQAPLSKWLDVIKYTNDDTQIYLVGAPSDYEMCEEIKQKSGNVKIENLCGKLSLMETAALFNFANCVYVNDSGPLHIASAMNTPVKVFYCSTIPAFGFGPLSDRREIMEVKNLACRPCGIHGHKNCPKGHFDCGNLLKVTKITA